jgi:hypothetical protein
LKDFLQMWYAVIGTELPLGQSPINSLLQEGLYPNLMIR